ncbi:MAG: T9SS C-terminal target domain-containing protein [Cytophagia bacterium]|nr:T9SS C-terminal target domain-containing protein [Cytophagia bacterium]
MAGQIRRDLTSSTGILKYTQSAGTVLVGNEATSTPLRGVFEVLNAGSQFNHSGGSFTIVRGNGSTSVASLLLEPASASITSGSTITIGNTTTPTGTIGIQATTALNNLAIAGLAASVPQVSMYVSPLTVNGALTVATGNTLNALGRDLTIGGDFTVNGTYISGNNTTTFNNAGSTTIGGALSSLSFYNFTKEGAGTLNLARNITVNRDLRVSTGTLSTASFSIDLLRHAEIDATISSASGSGLVFGSTLVQQQLKRSASGTGTLGIVTINNANGVIIPDGNGYDFNITNNLRMQSGIFDIGGSLLSLGVSALITPVSPYSAANLIQTNSSSTDKGVRKQFPTNYTTDFIFPVGQSNYTPVTFNFSSGTTGSSGTPTITVRPYNRINPVIVDDTVGEPPVINDLDNVLQYYWIINAANVSNTFSSTMSLQYVQPLVAVTSPYSEANYIAARILTDPLANPSLNIQKFSDLEVNETTNVITFSFTTITDQRNISGDYFAGVDQAIPNNVPTYTTRGGGAGTGNVGDNIYTTPVLGGIDGTRIIVSAGDVVTFNSGSVILYQTVIDAGAKIVIPSGSIGNSLGMLTGAGDLEINSNTGSAVLPAADYAIFFSCAGGGLIFGGSGNYEILGGITQLRELTLNGGGDKSLANNNLTICNNFNINNGSFFNPLNRVITVQNDFLMNGGTYSNSAGTLSITRDFVQTLGTFDGGTGGIKTIARNLIVSGGIFNPGSGTSNVIRVNGNMTVSAAATINSGVSDAAGQRFTFGGTTPQVLTGTFTASRAFNRLEINNPAGLTLAGDVTINRGLLLTNGLITPGVNRMLLGTSASVTPIEGSASSYVNGKLYKDLLPFNTFIFPIGKGTRWRNASIIFPSQTGTVTWDAEYYNGSSIGAIASAPPPRNNPVNNLTSSDPAILRISGGEYWKVSDGTSTSNGRTARVGLSWGIESDVSAVSAERESMTVVNWNGVNWSNNSGTNFQAGHTQSRGRFESSLALSFSENIVALGSTETANPLPVDLIAFVGKNINGFNKIEWKTASELNNDYFELERSATGETFSTITRVSGRGTVNELSSYNFLDEEPMIGNNYYRLKQVDFDGKFEYSHIILVKNESAGGVFNISVFPNPLSKGTLLNIRSIKDNELDAKVSVRDLTGRVLTSYTVGADNFVERTVDTSSWSGAGIYIVEMTQGEKRIFRRVVVD